MITFTQYLRPNGRKTQVEIDRPEEIETKANALIKKGCRFEIEEMMNTTISMTISYPSSNPKSEEGDFCHRISSNGPQVPTKVDEMINEGYERIGEL